MSDSPIQSNQPFQQPGKPAKKVKVLPMGILAVVATVLQFVGVPVVGWVGLACGIGAIVEGNKAKKADPNDSQAKTGFILGIVAVAIFAVSFVVSLAFVGYLASSGNL